MKYVGLCDWECFVSWTLTNGSNKTKTKKADSEPHTDEKEDSPPWRPGYESEQSLHR